VPRCPFNPFPIAMSSTISARIVEDMKTAMKAKDTLALNVVRGLKSAIKYAAIEKHGADSELDEADAIVVVRREIKKRQDSVEQYEKANRADLADTEKAEIAVLEKYLPAAMSASELSKIVEDAIAETGATTKKDMGKVMKLVTERAAGRADGKTISTEVGKRLQ
jgi:uncharacterized protein YqeY